MAENSAVIRMNMEKPLRPSGMMVLIMPTALRSNKPLKLSCSAPKYSPFGSSMYKKPPPVITEAFTRTPAPLGGLMAGTIS